MNKNKQSFSVILAVGLLLIACWGWAYFLNYGDIPFDFHDWAEVNAPRLACLKDAVTRGILPLHMPDSSALRGVTDRWMALPDMILSPQVLLLKWLDVGPFILVHTLLMILTGWLGMLRLQKRFSLNAVTFTWVWLLFVFNGHILSHYSVGHVTWGAYFLLTWFIEVVFRLFDGETGWRWTADLAFLLFGFFLQGSFHQFVWCVIFLGFLALANFRTMLLPILRAGVAACLLSMVRIIPPALQMGAFDDDFLGGYRSPKQLLNAFVRIIGPEDSLDQAQTGAVLGWWEFDTFIGITGFLFLLIACVVWLWQHKREYGFPQLLVPLCVMGLFSVRSFYLVLRKLNIPLFSGERVSSRFLILPFVFILVISAAALQNRFGKLRLFIAAGILGLFPAIYELWRHLETWKVTAAYRAFPYTYTDLSIKVAANHPDPGYTNGLAIGAAVSLLSAAFLIRMALHERRDRGMGV